MSPDCREETRSISLVVFHCFPVRGALVHLSSCLYTLSADVVCLTTSFDYLWPLHKRGEPWVRDDVGPSIFVSNLVKAPLHDTEMMNRTNTRSFQENN
ncbi:hypothetical protein AVEN_204101-1 [Araneus ventricosus]|uniref:Uncharacterized protein n=1 Tax=Araneus ventricosus TaxID=182803 RepID=A0A4Y2NS33_ARAVE|nr:hypothetical protein AVEN_204101-1 [Araneus ventricosus]